MLQLMVPIKNQYPSIFSHQYPSIPQIITPRKKSQSHQGVSSLYLFAVYCVVLACANLLADKVGQRRHAPGRQLEQRERHGDGWEVSGKVGDGTDFTIQNGGFTQETGD